MIREILISAIKVMLAVSAIIIFNACKKLNFERLTKCNIESVTVLSATTIKIEVDVFDLSSATHPDYGICYSATNQNPTISDAKVSMGAINDYTKFSKNIENLIPGTKYYFRGFVMDCDKPIYSLNIKSCLNDIDGNVYHTVTIGMQIWMVENLKTTHFRDGTTIPNVTDNASWSKLSTGAYCDYNYTVSNSDTYGRLYNWYAAIDTHNICPIGWHVPSDAEWTTLTSFLGGESIAGSELKEAGTTHWYSSNAGADNSSGFSALPGGERFNGGSFYDFGYGVYLWSSTASNINEAWRRYLHSNMSNVTRNRGGKNDGYSVRCLRDL